MQEWQKLKQSGGLGSGLRDSVTVDYIKTEDHIPAFEAAYPAKFNKMDYMGSCCRIRVRSRRIPYSYL